MNTNRRLARSTTDRVLAGVCGGIANYLNVDPTLVRLVFVLAVLFAGISPLLYLILWVIMPSEDAAGQYDIGSQIGEFAGEVGTQVNRLWDNVTSAVSQSGTQQSSAPVKTVTPVQHSTPALPQEPVAQPPAQQYTMPDISEDKS